MGLAISSLFTKLFGKKNMRILMGMTQYSTRESGTVLPYKFVHVSVLHDMLASTMLIHKLTQCHVCLNVPILKLNLLQPCQWILHHTNMIYI